MIHEKNYYSAGGHAIVNLIDRSVLCCLTKSLAIGMIRY
jgi:hypothetical protein